MTDPRRESIIDLTLTSEDEDFKDDNPIYLFSPPPNTANRVVVLPAVVEGYSSQIKSNSTSSSSASSSCSVSSSKGKGRIQPPSRPILNETMNRIETGNEAGSVGLTRSTDGISIPGLGNAQDSTVAPANARKRYIPHELQTPSKATKLRKVGGPSKHRQRTQSDSNVIEISSDESDDSDVLCYKVEFSNPGHPLSNKATKRSPHKKKRSSIRRPVAATADVIIISSPSPPKKGGSTAITVDEEDSYDEEDWEYYHAGLMLPTYALDDMNQNTASLPDQEITEELSKRLKHQQLGRPRMLLERGRPDIKVLYPTEPYQKWYRGWPQGQHPGYHLDLVRLPTLHGPGKGGEDDYTAGGLALVTSIRRASGPISVISQCGPFAAVASAALGGMPSPSFSDVRTCNIPGALLCWNQQRYNEIQTMDGHYREDECVEYVNDTGVVSSETMRVYYTVCDVKFDPLDSMSVVTSSKDGSLQSWQFDDLGIARPSSRGYSGNYGLDASPHHVDFKPNTSILAVGCLNGTSYLHTSPGTEPQQLRLKKKLMVEQLVWGPSGSSIDDLIFIGGREEMGDRGMVRYWKLRPEMAIPYGELRGFSGASACESLAVDSIGSRIALFAQNQKDTRHTVELYDTRCYAAKAIAFANVPSFSKNLQRARSPSLSAFNYQTRRSLTTDDVADIWSQGSLPNGFDIADEVLQTSFSSDGIFLACARDDNMTNVWDSRYMDNDRGKEPLFTLRHGPSKASTDLRDRDWGIAGMAWINHMGSSSPPLLVTGGDDGAIRLWDMRKSLEQEGEILAELETNVGNFVIGDARNGEMPLIAGDCHANLYVYDYQGKSGWRDW